MRKFLLMFLLCPLFVQAQEYLSGDSVSHSPILKFAPYALVDPLSSIQFGLEYQVGSKISLQHEIGYLTNVIYNDPTFKSLRGLRLRNEARFYLNSKGNMLEGLYVAPELLFIYLEHQRRGSLGFGCGGFSGCDYYQEIPLPVRHQVYALHAKFGYQSIYKRLVVDLYAGLGYRHVRVNYKDFSSGVLSVDDEFLFDLRRDEGTYHLPGFSLGFKVGYVLRR